MIENVGFLGQTESLVTEKDTNWNRANFAIAEETKFSNYGSALFTYNKFMGIFSGVLNMKARTVKAFEPIIKLPVSPSKEINVLCNVIKQTSNAVNTIDINTNGDVSFIIDVSFEYGDRVGLNFSFPLGGG